MEIKKNKDFLLSLLSIIIVGLLVNANSLHSEFQFDDVLYIQNNPEIYHLNWQKIASYHFARTIGTLTFALNYHFHGLNVFGYHLVNVVIHILSALFIWQILRILFSLPHIPGQLTKLPSSTYALVGAMLFLLHPMHHVTVNHITQRYSCLGGMFYFAAFYFYLLARLGQTSYQKWLGSIFCAISFVLGLWTKQTLFTFPLAVVLVEVCFLQRQKKIDWHWRHIVWISLFIGVLILTIRKTIGSNFAWIFNQCVMSHSHDGDVLTTWTYLFTQFKVLWIYIFHLIWPVNLSFDYDVVVAQSLWQWPFWFGCLGLIFLLLLAGFSYSRNTWIAFGILWFFINQIIESSIFVIPYMMVDYRVYISSLGFVVILLWFLDRYFRHEKVLQLILVSILVFYSVQTFYRNEVWRTRANLWTEAVRFCPHKSRAHGNLGNALLSEGDFDNARKELEFALALNPQNFEVHSNLGNYYFAKHDYDKALDFYQQALAIDSTQAFDVAPLNNMGVIYIERKQWDKAEEVLKKAVGLATGYVQAAKNLAKVYLAQNKIDKAINIYEQMPAIFPHENFYYIILVRIYVQRNDVEKAVYWAQQIYEKVPYIAEINEAAVLLDGLKEKQLAKNLFEKSLTLEPHNAGTLLLFGQWLGNHGHLHEAINVWHEGQRLNPDNPAFAEMLQQAETFLSEPKPKN